MRIPKFDEDNFSKCCNCQNEYTYTSNRCLHKLCDHCYNKKFNILGAKFECPYCKKENNEKVELSYDDFTKESPLQSHYKEDLKRKNEIYNLIYKRKENFQSNDEYNRYLEFVEKCIQKNNEKEITKKYFQNEKERAQNDEKRLKDLEDLRRQLKENSPNHYNSSKFCIDFEGNEIIRGETPIEQNTNIIEVKFVEEIISLIKDEEKMKKAGGYNINKIKEFFSNYSKVGFINEN